MTRAWERFGCVGLAIALAAGSATAQKPERSGDTDAPATSVSAELSLSVGQQKTIPAGDVKSYSEGVRGVCEVRLAPDGSQFIIVGQTAGVTTLLLIKKDGKEVSYTVNVFARSLQSVERELLQLLEGKRGVRLRRIGDRFFIEGAVSTEAELKRITQIAGLFPGQVESLVVVGGAEPGSKPNIRVDFLFVQYDSFKNYQFGVNWPAQIGGGQIATASLSYDFLAGATSSAQASVVDQPLPGLDIAAFNGWAKVLKHSTVITTNDTEANFSSGGEQNYVVSTGFNSNLQKIEFGTQVKVLPRFNPETRELEVKVTAEVADLTPPVAAGTNLPGRNVSKLDTVVSLKLGQSIVLSGIRSRSQRHSVGGLPLLSEIPVLGVLFGSHADDNQEVEGAIYVVPSVIDSIPKGAAELLQEALEGYSEFSGDMDEVNTWEKDPARASKRPASPRSSARVRTR
ncbi:MAG TPA: pilus assembly protein N-terminal domain-containing protein [Polyangiaceae bacterium]|nr:pilus assembly protein N-terminal domain-containing protein [Polyangiaceae bacterium]